jgi:hypothetical protein
MLSSCPDCIEDLTVQKETALHLAIKNNQFEAVKALVDWIRELNKEDTINGLLNKTRVLSYGIRKKKKKNYEGNYNKVIILLFTIKINKPVYKDKIFFFYKIHFSLSYL